MTEAERAAKSVVVINDLAAKNNRLNVRALPSYAWRPGYVYKYASLWISALRFCILNRPDFSIFAEIVCQNHTDLETQRYVNIDAYPRSRRNSIAVDFFVQTLGEDRKQFNWSNLADFPSGFRNITLSDSPAICLACIAQGFHTSIFSLRWLNKCPLHGDVLLRRCPICDSPLKARMRPGQKFAASICGCDNQWMSIEVARYPLACPDRDEVLSDIIGWIERISKKCWLYLPHSNRLDDATAAYRHISSGLSEFGEPMPMWIDNSIRDNSLDAPVPRELRTIRSVFDSLEIPSPVYDRLKVVSESLLCSNNLSRLNDVNRSREIGFNDLHNFKHSSYPLFKSINRYAIKHMLGNRVHLLYWVAKNHSAQLLTEKATKDRYVAIAWAILRWMRASIWRTKIVYGWLRGLLAKNDSDDFRGKDYESNYGAQRFVLSGAGERSALWIEHRVNAAMLVDLFPTPDEWQSHCDNQEYLGMTQGLRPRPPLEWWAWCDADSRLKIAIMQRTSAFWHHVASRAPIKDIRTAEAEKNFLARQLDLHKQLIAPGIQFGSDSSWSYLAEIEDLAHGTVKCSRLVMGKSKYYRFCVAELPRGTTAQSERWVLRCLDLPILVYSYTTREGVLSLKRAARLYAKSFSIG